MSILTPPIKVVLAGCGGISRAWLNYAATHPDLEFVGMVDLFPESAQTRQEEFGLHEAKIGSDLGPMIEETTPDVVFDCTIPEAHPAITIEALSRGCHVLGEKPLAPSMDEARSMIQAAKASGKVYAVIQNRRYLNGIVRYRNAIESGAIGALTTLNADFYLGPHFGGFRDEMEHVLLLDMAIHSFDQARFISGTDPISVYCHEWNPAGSWYSHGASAMCIFEMSDGVIFNYRGSWCAEGAPTAWACDWRAIGQKGTALWDGEDKVEATTVTSTEGFFRETVAVDLPTIPDLKHLSHSGVINEFIESLKAGTTPQTICTDNVKSLAMVLSAIESAESGHKVEIRY
ncbi:Gfo/Idh/MocA family oxidoreductase [Chloroflexi bacterium TSY]|nr:Gfo/Idh/MocA family oxidoreductase [Chloroflexi bacterium TSY]